MAVAGTSQTLPRNCQRGESSPSSLPTLSTQQCQTLTILPFLTRIDQVTHSWQLVSYMKAENLGYSFGLDSKSALP